MDTNNIITAMYNESGITKVGKTRQWAKGQILSLVGFPNLPASFEMYFQNADGTPINAQGQIGTDGQVSIPDAFFANGSNINAWMWLPTSEDEGKYVYKFVLPVERCPRPADYTYSQEQATLVDQAIAAMNEADTMMAHKADIAPTFSSSTAYAVGDYVYYNGVLYRFIADHAAGAWDGSDAVAAVIGDDAHRLWRDLSRYNAVDAFDSALVFADFTLNGITYDWTGSAYEVSGTATGISVRVLFSPSYPSIPAYIKAGQTVFVKYATTDPLVKLRIIIKDASDNTISTRYYTEDSEFIVPSGAAKWTAGLYIDSGSAITGTAVVSDIRLLTARSNADLLSVDILGGKGSDNYAPAFTNWRISETYSSDNRATPADVPINSFFHTSGSRLGSAWGLSDSKAYLVICFSPVFAKNVRYYLVFCSTTKEIYRGFSSDSGANVTWVREDTVFDTSLSQTGEAADAKTVGDALFGAKLRTDNLPPSFTYFKIANSYDSENRATPADIPTNSFTYTQGNRLSSAFQTVDGSYYYVARFSNAVNPDVSFYIVLSAYTPDVSVGYTANGGTTVRWMGNEKSLKVLCIGSSFGQDSVAYAPYIMENIAPWMSVTFGIAYKGSASIDWYNTNFDDTTQQITYSKRTPHGTSYVNTSKNLKEILSDEPWDIVMINQSAVSGGVPASYANVNAYLDKIVAYCSETNSHPVRLGYVMPQAAINRNITYTYSDMVDCVQSVMETTPIEFVVPCGTAIENARGTSLDSLGDYGHLTYDADKPIPDTTGFYPGHLQEGLPCMISGYVTAVTLCRETMHNHRGIMGNLIRATQSWVTSHAIPGQNGTAIPTTGDIDGMYNIAQKCAVAAIKKPFEVTTIVE